MRPSTGKTIVTPMRSKNVFGDRLHAPFVAVGEHIGCELPGGRVLFTTRRGGVSGEPFDTLNVGLNTADYEPAVEENRNRVAQLLGIPRERWLEVTDVLIFHGRRVCHSQRPRCAECAVFDLCPSRRL